MLFMGNIAAILLSFVLCQCPLFDGHIVLLPELHMVTHVLFLPSYSPKMLNVSQVPSSPAVSLVYAVKNGSVFLNGTAASNLLCQLSAELVGYFLFYPPLIIAERKSQSSSR